MSPFKKLVRKIAPLTFVRFLENAYRWGRGLFWQIRYGFPAREMKVIAVTGTNGKTTTCAFLNEVLKAAGYSTAVLNTVFYEFNGQKIPNKTHFTVHKQSIVQSFFAKAKRAKADWAIIEVTSQALDQGRIMGVPVEIAVITNLSQEHLDYHRTMKNYAAAKARLVNHYGAKHAVLNRDDKWFNYFAAKSEAKVLSFGKSAKADMRITEVDVKPKSTLATLTRSGKKLRVETTLPGEFNIYNAAAAAAAAQTIGVDEGKIAKGIANLNQVEGRMEAIDSGRGYRVYIDFAITPDAIAKALEALRRITRGKGKIRIVFGATGDRDKQKRPRMGQVAARYADAIYLTDDETYSENPGQIRNAVYEGIKAVDAAGKTKIIADRREAIKQALADSGVCDAVLVTGLGHEDSRNMGGKLVPWDDRSVVKKLLKNSIE